MGRKGWVSAQVDTDRWVRLSVFDDGWLELPGLGRSLSDTRAQLRGSLIALGIFVGCIVAASLVGRWSERLGLPVVVSSVIMFALVIGGAAYSIYYRIRNRARNRRQIQDDAAQAVADREQGRTLSMVPGAPKFRRADSAEQMAGWLDGEVHIRAADIAAVACSADGSNHTAVVTLRTGERRTYRSPDAKLTELLGSFANS